MLIHLNEIPKDGKTFSFTKKSGELNETLRDLVGNKDFRFDFFILPLGQAYDLSGEIETELPLECSFCANDFTFPIKNRVHELLIYEGQKNVKGDGSAWDDPESADVTWLKDPNQFDVAALARELVALTQPFQPICQESCKGICQSCGTDLNNTTCRCAIQTQNDQKNEKPNAFSVLKTLKLN